MAPHRMKKLSNLDMDLMARMRILEGALGAPRWSFSRDRRSIGEALKTLPVEYPEIHPDWFSMRDWGLQDAVIQGARAVLKTETGPDTAEEIAQNLAAGLSPTGGKKEDVYGWIGRKHGRKILSGRLTPKGIRNQLYMAGERRAVDVFRKMQTKRKQREMHSPTLVDTETQSGQMGSDILLDRSPMEALLSLLSSPAGNQLKQWLYRTLQRKATPMQMAVFEAWLDNPGASNAQLGRAPQVVAEKGAPISGQMAGRYLKSIVNLAKDEMKANPKVTDWIDRYMDLQQLGYGGGSLRYASKNQIEVHKTSSRTYRFVLHRASGPVVGHASLSSNHLQVRSPIPLLSREEVRTIRAHIMAHRVASKFLQ